MVVQPKQSNYDTYFMPKEVEDIGTDLPLYRLVSYWGLRRRDYICRDDIAKAFGISLRQASGIISSIYKKHEEVRCSLKRIKSGKGNVIKSYIFIQDVLEKPTKKNKNIPLMPTAPRKVREKQRHKKGAHLWSHLLGSTNVLSDAY